MDKLAEMSQNITPYRFGFNNPVFWSDPSGLLETRKEAREYRRVNGIEGRIQRNGEGGYDINNYETHTNYSSVNDKGFGNDSHSNDGVIESALVSNENQSSNVVGSSISTGLWGVNTMIGGLSTYMVGKAQFHRMNEAWHITKTAGTSFFWQSKWKNPGAIYHRANQMAKVENARGLSTN